MKYLSRKKISRTTKLGLITSGIYAAASFALPALANEVIEHHSKVEQTVNEEKSDVLQPVDLSLITTSGEAEILSREKLTEYAGDKFLSFSELENLSKIEGLKAELLNKENAGLKEEYEKRREPIKKLDKEIAELKGKVNNTYDYYNRGEVTPLYEVREKLKTSILCYYPALIDNKDNTNVTYSAETKLKPKLIQPFKEIIVEADGILKEHYMDSTLELLISQDEYTINDILILQNAIDTKNSNEDYLEKIRQESNAKISLLEEQKAEIVNSEQIVSLEKRLNSFDSTINIALYFVSAFEDYDNVKKEMAEFEIKYGNFNKQFFLSILAQEKLGNLGLTSNSQINGLGDYSNKFKRLQNHSIETFQKYAKAEGLEVEIEQFKNPAKTLVPWWLGFLAGFAIPMFRNVLVKSYVKGSDATGGEYFPSVVAGALNGMLGVIILDGLHPLVFPIRMLTPCAFQPLFKILKMDPCKYIDKEVFG